MIVAASRDRTPGFERTVLSRAVDFFNDEVYELRDGEFIRIDAPTDATVSSHRDWLLIELRTDWYTAPARYRAGSLLAANYDEFLSGTADLHVVFEPDEHTSLNHYAWTKDKLVIVTLADVVSRVQTVTPGSWATEPVPGIPDNTNAVIVDTDDLGDELFLDLSGFTTPSRLLHGPIEGPLELIKSAPSFFDAEDLTVTQHFATSKPTAPRSPTSSSVTATAPDPARRCWAATAGSRSRGRPGYEGVMGRLWLARGGTYVLANIRGGGEYGPGWHTQAMREGRHLVAEDFAAVAEDLVSRGITTVDAAGRPGRQQRRPADGHHADAVPGVVRRARVQRAAAGHAPVPPAAGRRVMGGRVRRPRRPGRLGVHRRVLAVPEHLGGSALSAAADDHVHPRRPRPPGHARKMTAALEAAGHHVQYYENIEGGHAGAADNAQTAFRSALIFEFLHRTLRD